MKLQHKKKSPLRSKRLLYFAIAFASAFLTTQLISKDKRVVVKDSIKGAKYEVTEVDGLPVEREDRGFFPRVSTAMIPPGKRTITIVSRHEDAIGSQQIAKIQLEQEFLQGLEYQIRTDEANQPVFIVTKIN